MIQIRGLVEELMTEKARQERKVTAIYRAVIAEIFIDIVKHTPQFSGNLTQNWQIEFTGYPGGYNRSPDYLGPQASANVAYHMADRRLGGARKMGDDPSVSETVDRELPVLGDVHWNTRVRIVNRTPYADDVQAGIGPNGRPIRDENLHYGKVAMVN